MNSEVRYTTQPNADVDNTPLILAQRYEKTSEKEKAARFYRLAGQYAFDSYQTEAAVEHFSNAITLTPGSQQETRFALMTSLERALAFSGSLDVRSENLVEMSALADMIDSDAKRAEVAVRLALFKLDNGDNQDVISIARLAIRLAQIAASHSIEAELLLVWGRALQRKGDYLAAQSKFQKSLVLAKQHDAKAVEADSYRYLGVVEEESGSYIAAAGLYNKALALYNALNDRRGSSDILNNLGKVAYDQGEYTAALQQWDQAKPSYLATGDKPGLCRLLVNQSAICMDMGDYARSVAYAEEALTLCQEISLRFGECLAVINLALGHLYQSNLDEAARHAQHAQTIALEIDSKRLQGFAHGTMGRLFVAQERFDEAAEQFWEALAIWEEMKHKSLGLEAEAGLANVAAHQNKLDRARHHVERILSALEDGQTLDGTESPFRIRWICYRVLNAAQDKRAGVVLNAAYQALKGRANMIVDQHAKQLFWEAVEPHRLIKSAFLA